MSDLASDVVSTCDYWMRVAISLKVCVKKALLNILHDQNINGLPRDEQQLYQKLHQFKHKVETDDSKDTRQLKKIIKSFQWQMMCQICPINCPNPCPLQGKTNSEDLDITCIVILITNLTTLQPPLGGWKIQYPQHNDTSKAAYVLFARELRNSINHCGLKEISTEQEFNNYWKIIENILIGLGYTDMIIFRDLETISLDTKTKEKIAALTDQMNTLKVDMESQSQQTDQEINLLCDITDDLKQQINGLEEDKILTDSEMVQLHLQLKCLKDLLDKRVKIVEIKVEVNVQRLDKQDQKQEEHKRRCDEHNRRINQLESKASVGKTSEKLSKQLRQITEDKYKNIFTSTNDMDHEVPKTEKRGDVVVGLSFIEKPEKVFFQAANYKNEETRSKELEVGIYRDSSSIVQQKRTELETVSSQETNYNDIMTTSNDYVIISGPPGCGKSTLCETFAYNWACNELWTNAPNFDYVFVLRFRNLNDFKENENVTAEKILRTSYPEYFKEESMVSNLNSLLILDGFDEFSNKYELLQERDEYSSFTRAVFDLLNPNNKKLFSARLVTSRPTSCSVLFKLFREQRYTEVRTFEITGFSKENINKYVEQFWSRKPSNNNDILETEEEKLKLFLSKIKETPTLSSMMTIPFYCSEVCRLMFDGKIGIDSIPVTYTGLFCNLLTLFLRDHGLKRTVMSLEDMLENKEFKPIILMLSKFAFIMEEEHKITFGESDIRRFVEGDIGTFKERNNFEKLLIRSGLVIKLGKKGRYFYQFFHYSFHEFLVALHIFRTGPMEGLVYNVEQYSYIISMVCGLAGGLVTDSKSNFFVKEYANMFQSANSPRSLQDVIPTEISILNFGMLIFEYQNIVHLTKQVSIVIDKSDAIEQDYLENLKVSENALDTREGTQLLAIYIGGIIPGYFTDLPITFERIIWNTFFLQPFELVRFFDVLLCKCRNQLELFVYDSALLSSVLDRYECNKQRSFPNVSIVFHVGESLLNDFSSLKSKFLKCCEMFKTVTVSLVETNYISERRNFRSFCPWIALSHTHTEDCLSKGQKEKVKCIANECHAGNLYFAASCFARCKGPIRGGNPYSIYIS